MDPYVVVGGGPAAAAAVIVLARAGARVVVLSQEDRAPYDRTAVSKSALSGGVVPALLPRLGEPGSTDTDGQDWTSRVEVHLQTTIVELDPIARQVVSEDGRRWHYQAVLLATGARPRRLNIAGSVGAGVHTLRAATDAEALLSQLRPGARLVIIGGGVIGLEVAAVAVDAGLSVEVVEAGPRILGRNVPAPVADWVQAWHRARGVRVFTGVVPSAIRRDAQGGLSALELSDGSLRPADVILVGIGIIPNDELALAAGLRVADGIVVDRSGFTGVAGVFAAGDVARMDGVRTESYSAAAAQGEVAARSMLGQAAEFGEVIWSWSDQGELLLQSAGLGDPQARLIDLGADDFALAVAVVDSPDGATRLVGVSGASLGPAIARTVRAASAVLAGPGLVEEGRLRAARGDLAEITRLFRAAARGGR